MNKTKPELLGIAPLLVLLAVLGFTGCSKPAMPVSVTSREATLDKSLVAQFRNNSNRHLTVLVRFENKTLGQVKDGYIEIAPLETKEIGWMEGWKFMSGEYVTLAHEDYAAQTVRVP